MLHCYSNRIISNRVLAQRKAQMVQSNIASSSKANLLAVGYRKTRAKMRQNRDKKAKWRTHIFEQGNHGNRKGELRKGGRVTNYAKQQESRRIHELLESKEIKKKNRIKARKSRKNSRVYLFLQPILPTSTNREM